MSLDLSKSTCQLMLLMTEVFDVVALVHSQALLDAASTERGDGEEAVAPQEPAKPRSWQPGDVVVLKCGGPAMTVDTVAEGRIMCRWFSEEDTLLGGDFLADTLEPWVGEDEEE